MNVKYNIFTLLIPICLFGCTENNENFIDANKTIDLKNFENTYDLLGSQLSPVSDSIFLPRTIQIVGDFLFIGENTTENILHIVDLRNDRYLGMRGKRGSGPGEILMAWKLFSPNDKTVGVFDTELGKVTIYNIDTLLHENRFSREFIDRDLIYSSAAIIHDETLFYLGNDHKMNARFYSKKLNQLESPSNEYGELPTLNSHYPNYTPEDEKRIFTFSNLINKDNLFVFPYIKAPLLEIFDLNKNQKTSISGPDELPSYDLFGKLRYYYSSYITENYIYLLYIEDKTKHSVDSHTVFVLHHDGSPAKLLNLDMNISQIAIYKDKYLYATVSNSDNTENSLFKFIIE